MEDTLYDAIVVGGGCAGSATAIGLSASGRSVLLLEREELPKDTLSPHFVWPRGASYLNRLGVLDRVAGIAPFFEEVDLAIEGVSLRGSVPGESLQERFRAVHGDDDRIVNVCFAARGHLLDDLLARYAAECGVTLRRGARLTGLTSEGGRTTGVRYRSGRGAETEAGARLVIGADGSCSRVARLAGARRRDVRARSTFACCTYVGELPLSAPAFRRRGRLVTGLVPTGAGQTMAVVIGPSEWGAAFRKSTEAHFARAFRYVSEDLASLLDLGGRGDAGFRATEGTAAYVRELTGDGWALVGDAASFTDPCTGTGVSHALRDAELLAQCVAPALVDGGDLRGALNDYQARRHVDSWKYYDFACAQAELHPPRASDVDLLRAVAADQAQRDRLIGVFGDTVEADDFFSVQNVQAVMAAHDGAGSTTVLSAADALDRARNPFVADTEAVGAEADGTEADGTDEARDETVGELALAHTTLDFNFPVGRSLLERTDAFHHWREARLDSGTWQYSRTLTAAPQSVTRLVDKRSRPLEGINFASQDYLGLSDHPAVRAAATEAIAAYGVHSAGSAAAIGNTPHSRRLERALAELVGMEHIVLFPTGWAAAYGAITSLVRHYDHVVMDRLAHASLVQGAYAASRNVLRYPHLDADAVRSTLRSLRDGDRRNGILVVAEGLYSMDADSPDLDRLQSVCREFEATLLLDVAHDLGSTGPGGGGQIALQELTGQIDLVMGSFSKTFASNGGFVATGSAAVHSYIETYGTSHVFSNALAPSQAAAALTAVDIARSAEGDDLRARLLGAATELRRALRERGLECLGAPGPIVPVHIGDERVARLTYRGLRPRNVAAMVIEHPVVPTGTARLRLQVMPSHTPQQCEAAAAAIADALAEARTAVAQADGRAA
ncbi:aminotransferase class I/II-fold pyridoxal phosphate-dependent enzyme [Streptomyces sp. NPDC050095]|uniref:aminotransferase class I/II-fold pyridoxal phosphate-dependent enzyme n=1 Tax=unclassified Streptomyces TaxID=2593676 RepID=UPI003445B9E8